MRIRLLRALNFLEQPVCIVLLHNGAPYGERMACIMLISR